MADTEPKAQDETVKSRWRTHAFVLFAAAIVALAFGTALKVQLDLPVWFSGVFGVLVFMAGSLGHLAVMRGQKISELESRSDEMRQSLEKLTAPVARYRRGQSMPQTPGEAAAAAAAIAPVEPKAPGTRPPGTRIPGLRAEATASRAPVSAAMDAAPTPETTTVRDAAAPRASATVSPRGRADDAAAIQDFVERLSREGGAREDAVREGEGTENRHGAGAPAAPAESSNAAGPRSSGTASDATEPGANQDEAAIAESVRQLRETATAMRSAAEPGTAESRAGHRDPSRAAPMPRGDDSRAQDDSRAPAAASDTGFDASMDGATSADDAISADDLAEDAMAAAAIAMPARPVDPRLDTLVNAMRDDAIEVFLEPIVLLAEKTPRHFEVSARFRDDAGNAVDPHVDPYGLRGTGILPLLDIAKIARVADLARRLADRGKTGSIFTSLTTETFEDDDFLNRFAEIYTERMAFAEQLVVTLAQDEARALSATQLEMVDDMRDLGFRFALDHVTSLDMDFETLRSAGVGFIKLDAAIFLEGLPIGDASVPAEDICRYLADLGFEVIVEEIADEETLARLVACGVSLGRGDVFGAARPVKAEVFAARSSAAA